MIKRLLYDKKGASLMTVLGAMLILTAVAVLVMTMSAANIRMSAKYNIWSSEYYDLDFAAEERLISFDNAALIPAELMARHYLQNNYFTYETAALFPNASEMDQAVKLAFSSGEFWTKLQTALYEKNIALAKLLEVTPDPGIPDDKKAEHLAQKYAEAQAAYEEGMKLLAEQTFNLLYYARADMLIKAYIAEDRTLRASNQINTYFDIDENWFVPPDTLDDLGSFLDGIKPPNVEITAFEETARPKQVTVRLSLKVPSYELLEQTRYVPLKINPLYTNAVSAGGKIVFNANASITGDVLSGNKGLSLNLPENHSSGIISNNGADVTINGNVYSAGDIHIRDKNGSISINEYAGGYTNTLKEKLFQNGYYYEGSATISSNHKENGTGSTVPYIYYENNGGNAYCNNLAIEENVENASLLVAKNAWTQDDIQNDGGTGTRIAVGGNYIGMSSEAVNGDPNGSSAIINNALHLGGEIKIDGNYIVPGTAFYIFKDASSNKVYYQTVESGSASTFESFVAYMQDGGKIYYLEAGDVGGFALFNGDFDDKLNYFKNNYTAASGGVTVKNNKEYYTLGMVINQNGNIDFDKGGSYVPNMLAYEEASAFLPGAFKSKTQFFGMNLQNNPEVPDVKSVFGYFTNPMFGIADASNGFYYCQDGAIVDLGTIGSGIIYCKGDLTISGGTFNGSIICEDDLTVNGSVIIRHSETEVLNVLGVSGDSVISEDGSGSRIARRFFQPLKNPLHLGQDLATEAITAVSPNVGERVNSHVDRYTINAWLESSKPKEKD